MHYFLDNKYTRWYFAIIEHYQKYVPKQQYEKHHIYPRSLCKLISRPEWISIPENIVKLPYHAHFICHRLLTKMTTNVAKIKMTYSMWRLVNRGNKEKLTSKSYELLRQQHSQNVSMRQKGQKRSDEFKQTLKTAFAKPEVKARKSKAQKIAQNRPEIKAQNSKRRKEMWKSDAFKEKQAKSRTSPETKLRKSKAIKAALSRPETKQKRATTDATPETKKRRAKARARRIHQIDINTQNIIMTFDSAAEAARTTGISPSTIVACALNKKTRSRRHSFYWRYA